MHARFAGRILTRTAVVFGVAGAVAVTVAARPLPNAIPQPTTPAPVNVQADSLLTIGAMMEAAIAVSAPAAPQSAPQAARAATGWPVDPQTGQTLINGQPVVGKVFVMKKTDGIEAYRYSAVYANEPGQPQRPIIGTSYTKPPLAASRRIRGIMVQSTLWSMDRKRSARMHHHFR